MNCKYDLSGTYLMTKSEFLAKRRVSNKLKKGQNENYNN